jgi:hypothetical protein
MSQAKTAVTSPGACQLTCPCRTDSNKNGLGLLQDRLGAKIRSLSVIPIKLDHIKNRTVPSPNQEAGAFHSLQRSAHGVFESRHNTRTAYCKWDLTDQRFVILRVMPLRVLDTACQWLMAIEDMYFDSRSQSLQIRFKTNNHRHGFRSSACTTTAPAGNR